MPDFQGDLAAVRTIAQSGLDVYAHNVETVSASGIGVRAMARVWARVQTLGTFGTAPSESLCFPITATLVFHRFSLLCVLPGVMTTTSKPCITCGSKWQDVHLPLHPRVDCR